MNRDQLRMALATSEPWAKLLDSMHLDLLTMATVPIGSTRKRRKPQPSATS